MANTQQTPPPPKRTGLIVGLVLVVICVVVVGYFILRPKEVSDDEIREKVLAQLHGASMYPSLQQDKVSVRVEKGFVTLTGEVPDTADKDSAANLAGLVVAREKILNDIAVARPTPVPTPRVLATPRVVETPEIAVVETPRPRPNPTKDSRDAEFRTWLDLGNKELNKGDPDYNKAISYFKQALEIDPNNRQAQDGLRRAQRARDAEATILRNR